jgi:NADH-quinone oxidoreductase subunit J
MFDQVLFLSSALLVVAGSLAVTFSKNLMHACVYLLTALFGVAGLYAVIGADFLAAAQLMVYVGGVVILMIFAVMLTGGHSDQPNRFGLDKIAAMGNIKTYTIAGLSVVVLSLVVLKIIANILRSFKPGELPELTSTVEKIGMALLTDHVLAFEISSILLLGALVGAAVIARPKRS